MNEKSKLIEFIKVLLLVLPTNGGQINQAAIPQLLKQVTAEDIPALITELNSLMPSRCHIIKIHQHWGYFLTIRPSTRRLMLAMLHNAGIKLSRRKIGED